MSNFWKKLPRPFIALAPMENVTDYAFREIVATELPRPDVCFTEFTNVEALNSEGFYRTIHRFKFSENQRPIVAQVWGMKPENYQKAAKLIVKLGFDGIDINMGCPDKTVVKIGACSALINNRPLAKEIIEATKKGAGKLPVSVKTRLGLKEVVTEEWITFLLEQKIAALTVHGRSSKQMSDVPADWDEIKKTVQIRNKISPDTIIIGNGDVINYTDGVEKCKKYGTDGAMIATGMLHNPWAFDKEDKVRTLKNNTDVLIKHLELCDDNQHYDKIKKFYKMYINNFEGASKLRGKLMETKTIEEALKLL